MENRKLKNVLLGVGAVIISDEPAIYWTPLGPCVSVIFHDPVTKVCAMTHSLLPEEKTKNNKCHYKCPTPSFRTNVSGDELMKYVTSSIRYIVKSLEEKKNNISSMNIYLFGGTQKTSNDAVNFKGEHQNSISAINILNSLNLKIKFQDIGGNRSRTIFFNTTNGEYEINYLQPKQPCNNLVQ